MSDRLTLLTHRGVHLTSQKSAWKRPFLLPFFSFFFCWGGGIFLKSSSHYLISKDLKIEGKWDIQQCQMLIGGGIRRLFLVCKHQSLVGLKTSSSERWRLLFPLLYYPKITFQTWSHSRLGGGRLIKRESGSSGRPAFLRGIQTHAVAEISSRQWWGREWLASSSGPSLTSATPYFPCCCCCCAVSKIIAHYHELQDDENLNI